MNEREKLIEECIEANKDLDTLSLLNWTMNQLFRAARTVDLLHLSGDHPVAMGCDASATVILNRLIKTKEGWQLIQSTNPKLLIGCKEPNV